jgi:hypothetical protein
MGPVQNFASLLTTDQLATQFGIHPVTLRTARKNKSLGIPYIRIGGSIRYRPEDVVAFLDSHKEGGAK